MDRSEVDLRLHHDARHGLVSAAAIPLLKRETRPDFNTLLDAASLNPDEAHLTAVIYVQTGREPIAVSRAELFAASVERAQALRQAGIKDRDLVIIARTQDLESIYLFWGALMIGAIPALFHIVTEKIPAELYFTEIPELIHHSGARAVLTTDEFAALIRERVSCPVYGSSQLRAKASTSLPRVAPRPEDIAFIQYSSGSTGAKKGIAMSHEAILNHIASYSEVLEISSDDVIVSWMPLYHDGGMIAGHLLPLIQGVPLVLISPFDWVAHPSIMFKALDEFQGTLCWMPNFAYNHCARRVRDRDLEGLSLTRFRAFINAAEPVRESSHQMLAERFSGIGIRSQNLTVMYGMAENVLAITQTPMWEQAGTDVVDQVSLQQRQLATPVDRDHPDALVMVSCGRPLPGVEVAVVDQDMQRLAERQVGELIFRSNCMLSGYYKRPDLDEATIVDGWHLTGDLGYIAEGEIYVSGRKKDMIIHAGKNIYPHDIEEIVNRVPGVHPGRVVVFGVFDEREGTEVIAVMAEADRDDPADQAKLRADIRKAVARESTVAARYVEIAPRGWIIKTSSGKIARAANREKWEAQFAPKSKSDVIV